jgi:hypothetical protein
MKVFGAGALLLAMGWRWARAFTDVCPWPRFQPLAASRATSCRARWIAHWLATISKVAACPWMTLSTALFRRPNARRTGCVAQRLRDVRFVGDDGS